MRGVLGEVTANAAHDLVRFEHAEDVVEVLQADAQVRSALSSAAVWGRDSDLIAVRRHECDVC